MANTLSSLSYANTFGHWVVQTNALIVENNALATGDYNKTSGTLYLNETTQNSLQANGSVVVQKELLVQGVGSSATIQKNMSVGGQVYFSNTTLGLINSGQANINGLLLAQGPGIGLSVSNSAYVGGSTTIKFNTITDTLQANTSVNTSTISVTGNVFAANITANGQLTAPMIYTNNVNTTNVYATGISQLGKTYVVGDFNVSGNFSISGTTLYDTNVITLSNSTPNRNNFIGAYRTSTGSIGGNDNTAYIRWNESDGYFDTTANVATNIYYRILTNQYISSSLTSTSATNVASSAAANALNSSVIAAGSYANSAFLVANTPTHVANSAALYANGAFIKANTAVSDAAGASQYANSAYTQANTATSNAAGASLYANGAFIKANTAVSDAASASLYANAAFLVANAAGTSAFVQAAFLQANTGFTQANTAVSNAAGASLYANAAYIQANAAYYAANNALDTWVRGQANSAFDQANAAYTKANTAGVSITDDISTNATRYIMLSTTNTGLLSVANTSSSKLYYNPSLGRLYSTDFQSLSDASLKEKVETITGALNIVNQLRGVTFEWKQNGTPAVGVIAQEVEQVVPQIVDETSDGLKHVSYDSIIGILIEAVKELSSEVVELKKKLNQ